MATDQPSTHPGMGAFLYPGGCAFRVWAPNATTVLVVGDFTDWQNGGIALAQDGGGYWSVDVPNVQAGQRYKFVIENAGDSANNKGWIVWRVDAYAKKVENSGEDANGLIVDPTFPFSPFTTPAFENFLIYQLHVGSFAGYHDDITLPPGSHTATFQNIEAKLGYIREMGFNTIELLPIGETLSDIGEGYAPTNFFAPETDYGRPRELRALVDAAHRQGLAVIFDVVFNHAATEDNRYWDYDGMNFDGGIYFEHGGDTPFGRAPAHWKLEVQNFFLDNARLWFNEYAADGLRFDAVHYIAPDSVRHFVGGTRHDHPDKYLIAEYMRDDPHPVRDQGFHAIWSASAPYAFRDACNGNQPLEKLKTFLGWWGFDNQWNHVRYLLGSHDDVCDNKNGAQGDKRYFVELFGGRDNWYARAKARLGWALNVAIPGTPMLFMGEECHHWGYWHPDPDGNGDHRFDWNIAGDPLGMGMRRLVTEVNWTRWNNPALRSETLQITHEDARNSVLAFKRWNNGGNVILAVVNLSDGQWQNHDYGVNLGGENGAWEEIFNSQSPQYGGWSGSGNYGHTSFVQPDGKLYVNLPKWSVLLFRKK